MTFTYLIVHQVQMSYSYFHQSIIEFMSIYILFCNKNRLQSKEFCNRGRGLSAAICKLWGCPQLRAAYKYSVDRQCLVDPYPFTAIKRVWIDQDVIDGPHCMPRTRFIRDKHTQIVFLITESGYIFIQLCNSYLQKWGRRKGEQCRFSERVIGRKKGRRDIKDLFCLVFCAQFDDFFYAKSSVDSLKWHT